MSFRANPVYEAQMAPRTRAELAHAAERSKEQARGLANRIMPRNRGDEIEVQVEGDGVYLVNTSYGSHIDEFGSRNNPPYAPLRRGVVAAGYQLRGE